MFIIVIIIMMLIACTPQPIKKHHSLTGGVKEPDDSTNCWVQPYNDELWYPCGQRSDKELGTHGH